MAPPARPAQQRKQDTLNRLEQDEDAWISTAGADGGLPYLTPLSFLWDGTGLIVATPPTSPTARNLRDTGKVRVGVGPTRDVVLIEGTARELSDAEAAKVADPFTAKAGFDPRKQDVDYRFFRIEPQRILAWREANELAGRVLMKDGRWVL